MQTAHNDIAAMETLNHIAHYVDYFQWSCLSPLEKSLIRITVQDYRNDPNVSDDIHAQARDVLAEIDALGSSTFVQRPKRRLTQENYESWEQRGGTRLEIY